MVTRPDLSIQLSADDRKLRKDLDRSARRWKRYGRGVRQEISKTQRLANSVTSATVGVTAVAAGLARITSNAAKAGDEIAKAARNAGIAADAYQSLSFAAEQAGSSAETVTKAAQELSRRLGSIETQGSGYKLVEDALKAINLRFEDLRGLTPDKQFSKVTEALKGLDPAIQQYVGGQLLGNRSIKEFGTLLDATSPAVQEYKERLESLGLAFSQESLNNAEFLADRINEIRKAARVGFNDSFLEGLSEVAGLSLDNPEDWDQLIVNVREITGFSGGALSSLAGEVLELANAIVAFVNNPSLPAFLNVLRGGGGALPEIGGAAVGAIAGGKGGALLGAVGGPFGSALGALGGAAGGALLGAIAGSEIEDAVLESIRAGSYEDATDFINSRLDEIGERIVLFEQAVFPSEEELVELEKLRNERSNLQNARNKLAVATVTLADELTASALRPRSLIDQAPVLRGNVNSESLKNAIVDASEKRVANLTKLQNRIISGNIESTRFNQIEVDQIREGTFEAIKAANLSQEETLRNQTALLNSIDATGDSQIDSIKSLSGVIIDTNDRSQGSLLDLQAFVNQGGDPEVARLLQQLVGQGVDPENAAKLIQEALSGNFDDIVDAFPKENVVDRFGTSDKGFLRSLEGIRRNYQRRQILSDFGLQDLTDNENLKIFFEELKRLHQDLIQTSIFGIGYASLLGQSPPETQQLLRVLEEDRGNPANTLRRLVESGELTERDADQIAQQSIFRGLEVATPTDIKNVIRSTEGGDEILQEFETIDSKEKFLNLATQFRDDMFNSFRNTFNSDEFRSKIRNAFRDGGLVEALEQGLGSVGDIVADTLEDSIINSLATDVSDFLSTAISDFFTNIFSNIGGGEGVGGFFANLFSFDSGGVVPGPRGAPTLALVHGQEVVLNPEQVMRASNAIQGGGLTVQVFNESGSQVEVDDSAVDSQGIAKVLVRGSLDSQYASGQLDSLFQGYGASRGLKSRG